MAVPICPKCGAARTSRKTRRGLLQRLIFDRLGRFPWQCSECSFRFVSSERGTMKKKKKRRHSSSAFDQTLLPMPPTRNIPAKRKPSESPAEPNDTED